MTAWIPKVNIQVLKTNPSTVDYVPKGDSLVGLKDTNPVATATANRENTILTSHAMLELSPDNLAILAHYENGDKYAPILQKLINYHSLGDAKDLEYIKMLSSKYASPSKFWASLIHKVHVSQEQHNVTYQQGSVTKKAVETVKTFDITTKPIRRLFTQSMYNSNLYPRLNLSLIFKTYTFEDNSPKHIQVQLNTRAFTKIPKFEIVKP